MTRVCDWGESVKYPSFFRLFHTSTPLRSVGLGTRKEINVLSHFHTCEKYTLRDENAKWGSCGQRWTFVSIQGLSQYQAAL